MLRSLQEYSEYWQTNRWEYENITAESCIFFETGDSPMAEGCYALPDFGHVICFYRYFRAPSKPEPQQERSADIYALLPGLAVVEQLYGQSQPEITDDEFEASWAATEQALDALLMEFIEQRYQPGMSERLQKIVKDSLIGFWLEKLFILPDDLDAALAFTGNPLFNEEVYETEEDVPPFDLDNPAHCAALKERIFWFGR